MAWETAAGLAGMATVVAAATGAMVISGRPTKLKHLTAQTDMAAQSPSAGPSSQGDWSWQQSEADTACTEAAAAHSADRRQKGHGKRQNGDKDGPAQSHGSNGINVKGGTSLPTTCG